MSTHLFNELVTNNYLIIKPNTAMVNKVSQKRGSPLDRYKSEILFFRNEMSCSYTDISKWLKTYKKIQRSHTQIASIIKQWEQNDASKKNES